MGASVKSHYIPTLDGLRAVSIILVIVSHCVNPKTSHRLVEMGHVGVLMFFALSGFLITTRLLQEYTAAGRISLRNFYVRRIFRILPPSLFYLGVISILAASGLIQCSWRAIRSALFLYTNYAQYGDMGWKIGHFWSLSVEEHFYLFWPALLILFGVRRGQKTAAALAGLVITWRIVDDRYELLARLFHNPNLAFHGNRTDLIADALLWGCCLAFYYHPRMRFSLSPAWSTAIVLSAAALLTALFSWHINHGTILAQALPTVILGGLVAAPNAPIGRLLELPLLRYIGRISYSLYIWQQLFVGQSGLLIPLSLLGLLACALFSYYVIEQPSIRYGRRFLSRSTAAPLPSAGAQQPQPQSRSAHSVPENV
ncbi:acyltransferase family protein [Paracidobacterium acidisoli]|uniref:acyltransferase family protein n=1 Tax=Paracidobacterium acidisoli TaxID=2303751 RepID=UPI001314FE5C|nr:acyltransferase [Paracidobacterium acidisoli]MBT9331826.1 acyltransferase [Paracidobacterium acidisoli]